MMPRGWERTASTSWQAECMPPIPEKSSSTRNFAIIPFTNDDKISEIYAHKTG
jgi:hypothetical protein